MDKDVKIYVAGHSGLVGSAIVRELKSRGYENILGVTSRQVDLRRQQAVEDLFKKEKPEVIFLAAAKVGGILANDTYRGEFIYDNLMIAANLIHESYRRKVRKLINLGSSCIYPKDCPQPMRESHLLTGLLEPTNEPYAVAKIAALKLAENYGRQYGCDFFSLMPTNIYGPLDNFDLKSSHVIPAMLRKFHEAKVHQEKAVTLWGSGSPKRDFLFSDDLAKAAVLAMESVSRTDLQSGFCNVGSGAEISIRELAELVRETVGFGGKVEWDKSKPDGMLLKRLDNRVLKHWGWKPQVNLQEGLQKTYSWFLENNPGTGR